MDLQEQIEAGRQTVRAEAYSMSIGEIVNLYTNREIVIRPEFQRLFRWTIAQKSRLIESILLGIPLPSVFVMQRADNVWEVIDGLQRLSTILEFMGELRDEESGEVRTPSVLSATEYLPDLEGIAFEREDGPSLTAGQRLSFKRAKIDIKILLPESDEKAKYELFDRLNTGGAVITPQEVRNAQLVMRDKTMFEWLDGLRRSSGFRESVTVSERLLKEQYDMELVCRYLALRNSSPDELRSINNIDEYLTKKIFEFSSSGEFDRTAEKLEFERVFGLISGAASDDAFRRYDVDRGRFVGAFSVSAFEATTIGVAKNIETWLGLEDAENVLLGRIMNLWQNDGFRSRSGSGIAASTRIPNIAPVAEAHFNPNIPTQ